VSRRLFVALVPPPEVRTEAKRAGEHLRRALPQLQARFADPDAAHLTLAFLGQVEEASVPRVTRAVAGVARTSRRFVARTSGLGAFPNARRPSVLWIGLSDDADGALERLQQGLAEALGGAAGSPDRQRFVPHLTLARVKTLRGVDRAQVDDALAGFEPAAATWPVTAMVLFESELQQGGARHTPLLTAPLGQPGPRGADADRER